MKRILSLAAAATLAAGAPAQSELENYILTVERLDGQGTDSILTVRYFDGLGRPEHTVTGGTSPVGSYLHSRNTYDALDRLTEEWLPVPLESTGRPDMQTFKGMSLTQYSDSCSRTIVRHDGQGRPLETRRPGSAWQDRPQLAAYSTNAADEVKRYAVEDGEPVMKGFYPPGTLTLAVSTDEDGKTAAIYRDLTGSVILERRAGSLDTYRVYDELGRLRFVLPPMYQDDSDTDAYAFRYTYDDEGRIATRKLPGCEPEHYWYDAADRVIRMQDGELAAGGRCRVFGYDGLGRLVSQSVAAAGGAVEYDEVKKRYDRYDFLDACTEEIDSGSLSSHLRGNPSHSTGRLTGIEQRASNGEPLLTTFAYDAFGRIVRKGTVGLGGHLTVCDITYNFVGDVTDERCREYEPDGNAYTKVLDAHIEKKYELPHTKLLSSYVITIESGGVTDTETVMCPDYDDFGNVIGIDRGGTAADMTYVYDLFHGWVKEISSSGGFEQRLYREDNTGHELYNGSISAMTWRVPDQNYERRYDYTYDGMNRLTEGAYSHLPVLNPHPGIINSTGEEILATGESSPLSLIPVIDAPGDLVGPISINAADQYTERISYDKNSNITSLERYGMNNQRHYGLIDSLVITRNGNQLKTIEDYAEKDLTYTGASDFYDGLTNSTEYTYNANGALSKDMNRKIGYIGYDDLGHLRRILYHNGIANSIEYIYAADGTKLRTIHRGSGGLNAYVDSIDYVGNLILKNGQPKMYLFDGGYASFNNDTINGWHYYIQDYMGNNRMVVNSNGTVEQITHYYPYGGVIGDISTNENVQKYKFEGKELDRTFGLDNYDIHARQYFAMMPSWDRIDPLAEKYFGISPYAYCGGDPVNYGDYDGLDRYALSVYGYIIGPEKDDSQKLTLFRENHPEIPPYEVPDILQHVIEDMAEKRVGKNVTQTNSHISSNGQRGHYSITKSNEVYNLFLWLVMSNPEGVEWLVKSYNTTEGIQYYIGTYHNEEKVGIIDDAPSWVDVDNNTTDLHNHLIGGTEGGSNYSEQGQGDMANARNNPQISFYVLVPQKDGLYHLYRYTRDGKNIEATLDEIINQ